MKQCKFSMFTIKQVDRLLTRQYNGCGLHRLSVLCRTEHIVNGKITTVILFSYFIITDKNISFIIFLYEFIIEAAPQKDNLK